MTVEMTSRELLGNGTATDPASVSALEDVEQSPHSVRPIFVIGSQRSGASLLALSLGQHANIVAVPDTAWLEHFAIGVQQTYNEDAAREDLSQLKALGVDIDSFFAQFGLAIDQLMRGPHSLRTTRPAGSPSQISADSAAVPPVEPVYTWRDFGQAARGYVSSVDTYRPARWVDGCYTHCFIVFPLTRLFPSARFIHVLRDVDEVVESLTNPRNEFVYKSRHVPFTPLDAYEHWLDAVTACVEAERALGSDMVMRIRRRDLVADPELTLRRCFDFLGETFDQRCLSPFQTIHTSNAQVPVDASVGTQDAVLSEIRRQAQLLSFALLEDPSPVLPRPGDDASVHQLEAAFAKSSASLASGDI